MSRALGLGIVSYGKTRSLVVLTFIFLQLLFCFPLVHAQNSTNFTSVNAFSIPASNSQIRFATNGTYSSATLQDNAWIFTDLVLYRSPPLKTFKISAENSNVTILSYQTRNATSQRVANEVLRYRVVGDGQVILNLGISNAGQYGGSDWYVSKPGRNQTSFLSLGHDYIVENDGTLIINGLTGNISVTHMFLDSFHGNNTNLPFYQQHSVIIAIAFVMVLTLAVVLVIRLRNNRIELKKVGGGV
jgi:hypothetical protein